MSRRRESSTEQDKRKVQSLCGLGTQLTFGPIQWLVRLVYLMGLLTNQFFKLNAINAIAIQTIDATDLNPIDALN